MAFASLCTCSASCGAGAPRVLPRAIPSSKGRLRLAFHRFWHCWWRSGLLSLPRRVQARVWQSIIQTDPDSVSREELLGSPLISWVKSFMVWVNSMKFQVSRELGRCKIDSFLFFCRYSTAFIIRRLHSSLLHQYNEESS